MRFTTPSSRHSSIFNTRFVLKLTQAQADLTAYWRKSYWLTASSKYPIEIDISVDDLRNMVRTLKASRAGNSLTRLSLIDLCEEALDTYDAEIDAEIGA
jgi:hypothetical protein